MNFRESWDYTYQRLSVSAEYPKTVSNYTCCPQPHVQSHCCRVTASGTEQVSPNIHSSLSLPGFIVLGIMLLDCIGYYLSQNSRCYSIDHGGKGQNNMLSCVFV